MAGRRETEDKGWKVGSRVWIQNNVGSKPNFLGNREQTLATPFYTDLGHLLGLLQPYCGDRDEPPIPCGDRDEPHRSSQLPVPVQVWIVSTIQSGIFLLLPHSTIVERGCLPNIPFCSCYTILEIGHGEIQCTCRENIFPSLGSCLIAEKPTLAYWKIASQLTCLIGRSKAHDLHLRWALFYQWCSQTHSTSLWFLFCL